METYNLKTTIPHIMSSNIKEKVANIIVAMITGSRLGQQMKFSSYAHIDFDTENDTLEMKPIVTEQEAFNRLKTNCIIFDLTQNKINNKYNKCFIYLHSSDKDIINYGYIMYNTENDETYHCFYIEPAYDELTRHLINFFITLKEAPLREFFYKKQDAIKNKDFSFDCSTSAYDKVVKEYRKIYPYNPVLQPGVKRVNRFCV